MNEYEPENHLQKLFDQYNGRCLCGHFEFCENCDGTNSRLRSEVVKTATEQGFQLYENNFDRGTWKTIRVPVKYEYYTK